MSRILLGSRYFPFPLSSENQGVQFSSYDKNDLKKKVSCNEIQTCWRELMNSCFLEVTPCLWFRWESRALGMRSDGTPRLLFTIHYKSWPSESHSLSVYILGTLVLQNWKKARNKVCMSDLLVSSQIFLFFYPVFSTSFSNHLVSIPRGSYYFF